jgi:phosphodiesterase/alkaline phosphatase D-like protein
MKKLLLGLVTLGILAAAVFLLPGQSSQVLGTTWDGNLAVIRWAETLADPTAAPDEAPFALLSGPSLGWLTDREATISWEVVAEKSLTTSPYASLPAAYPADKIQFRSATLTGLEPDTEYRYQLKSGRYEGKAISFRTLPPPVATSFKFAMVGDTQRGEVPESAEIERKLFAHIHGWRPAVLLHLGDMLNTGRGDGIASRTAWHRTLERNRTLRGSVFMAPTAGNHCLAGKGHGWYADYFAEVKGQRREGSWPPFFYSFDVANVHFVSLCTESAKVAGKQDVSDVKHKDLPFTYNEQLAWFENDLKSTQAPWKVVFFHQPFHTAGPHPAPAYFTKDYGGLCDRYGVQLVLSGHDHSYQKTKRISNVARQVSDTGSVQVISGGGDIKQFDRVKNPPHWNLVHKKINHYVQVEVSAAAMQFTAVDVTGQVFDVWRLPLQGQPEALEQPTAGN